MVKGMEISNSKDEPDTPKLCTSCIHGKATQTVIPKTTDTVHPHLLYCVHSDICGPMRTTTHTSHHYFSTFTDSKSHHITIYLQKTKDKTFDAFKAYVTQAEVITGKQVNFLHTDGGGEYNSTELNVYPLRGESTMKRPTRCNVPYTADLGNCIHKMTSSPTPLHADYCTADTVPCLLRTASVVFTDLLGISKIN
jgi:hypothetical protein